MNDHALMSLKELQEAVETAIARQDSDPPDIEQIQRLISDRVCRVMIDLKTVPKNGYNAFAKYKYATADDVFTAVRTVMATHGLSVRCQEVEDSLNIKERGVEGKETMWMGVKFDLAFDLAGVGQERPERRTIMVPVTGPQSFQASTTYAIKYWLRGRFLLDTGEEDVDATEKTSPDPGAAPKQTGRQARPAAGRRGGRRNTARTQQDQTPANEPAEEVKPVFSKEPDPSTGRIALTTPRPEDPSKEWLKEYDLQLFITLRELFGAIDITALQPFLDANENLVSSLPPKGQEALATIASGRLAERDKAATEGEPG